MKQTVIEELLISLKQGEDEVRNGAIIGALVINAYKDFEFDFKKLEKVLERSYSHKVAILSLSYIIQDKKIRKKFNNLIKKYVTDGYSSVRKAAAFSEPGFWGLEKKKNQIKKIRSLRKHLSKLNKSYIEGILLGLGINALDLDYETYDDIIEFFSEVYDKFPTESISISICYGLSLFAVATNSIERCVPIIKNIKLTNKGKRVRTSTSESLAFLNGFNSLDQALEIIEILIMYPAYHETWPLNLSILLAYLNNISPENVKKIVNVIKQQNYEEPEVVFLLNQLEKNTLNPLQVLTACLSADYSQLRLAALFSTYYAEKHKEKLNKKESDFITFADLSINLLSDPSGSIRSFALYRLLSYSLTLNTDKFLSNFSSLLRDQLYRNRLVSAIAITYITALMKPENLSAIKEELYNTKDPQVKKGVLIGMGMGMNSAIHDSDTADELILGLLELSGESTSVGYILAINTL